jgi:hypothetical protein
MDSVGAPAGEGEPEVPAVLLSEVTKHLGTVSEHADELTVALLGDVTAGEATWCANKRIYQHASAPPPPHDLAPDHKGRKGRRKQRRQPKQEL